MNGYYAAGLVHEPEHPAPRKAIEQMALPALGCVQRRNQDCLHGFIGDVPPVEFKAELCAEIRGAKTLVSTEPLGCHKTKQDSTNSTSDAQIFS